MLAPAAHRQGEGPAPPLGPSSWRAEARDESAPDRDRGRGTARTRDGAGPGRLALLLRAGDIIINADGGFAPRRCPRHATRRSRSTAAASSRPSPASYPPIIKTITIEFDRHGSLETTGLAVCTQRQAGRDHGRPGPPELPGGDRRQRLRPRGRRIPRTGADPGRLADHPLQRAPQGGNATVLAHAYTTVPAPTTFIVPVVIERIHKGVYGYRTEAEIPKIAGGAGIPISGHLRSAAAGPTRASSTPTSTPAAKPAASRPAAIQF